MALVRLYLVSLTRRNIMEAEAAEIVCDLDKAKDVAALEAMGGHHLVRLIVLQTRGGKRKRITFHLSARISGDIRAGCTDGVHVQLAAVHKGKDTLREVHGRPWVEVDEKGNPIL